MVCQQMASCSPLGDDRHVHGVGDAPGVDGREGGVRPGPCLGAALLPVVVRKV